MQKEGYQGVGGTKSGKKWTQISDAVRKNGDSGEERFQCFYADFEVKCENDQLLCAF